MLQLTHYGEFSEEFIRINGITNFTLLRTVVIFTEIGKTGTEGFGVGSSE
jgi:hypothetical protein